MARTARTEYEKNYARYSTTDFNDIEAYEAEFRADVLAYLSDKYGETFTIPARAPEDYPGAYREIYAYPVANPQWNATVKYDGEFHDNYVRWLLHDDIEAYFQAIADQTYADCKMIYSPNDMILVDRYGRHTTAEEFISENRLGLVLFVAGNLDKYEEDFKSLAERLITIETDLSITIIYSDKDLLPEIHVFNRGDYMRNRTLYYLRGTAFIRSDGTYSVNWEEGTK